MYSNLTVPMPSAIELNILGGTLLINIKWQNNKTCARDIMNLSFIICSGLPPQYNLPPQ